MARSAVAVPAELARRNNRVIRPQDAAGIYAQPRPEFARLVRNGAARKLAQGYYALVPDRHLGSPAWRPTCIRSRSESPSATTGREVRC